jgi:hypothetical protein
VKVRAVEGSPGHVFLAVASVDGTAYWVVPRSRGAVGPSRNMAGVANYLFESRLCFIRFAGANRQSV